jgi:hypothetical protein
MWPAIGRFGCKFFLQGKKTRIIIIHGRVAWACSQETTEAEDYDRATNPNGDRGGTHVRAETYGIPRLSKPILIQ